MYNVKRQKLFVQQSFKFSEKKLHAVHWKWLSEDVESNIEISDLSNVILEETDNTVENS